MKQKTRQKRKRGRSVQALMGIRSFTRYGLNTDRGGLLFFLVSPANLAVLSHAGIERKIRHLMLALSAFPDLEIACTDSSECFDDNKAYLKGRLKEEADPKVRRLLQKDVEFLDQIQMEMASARQFLFLMRLKDQKGKQAFETANRVEKLLSEQGFEARRMGKGDIKRFLALYFDASMNGELLPDVDGGQFFETVEEALAGEPSARPGEPGGGAPAIPERNKEEKDHAEMETETEDTNAGRAGGDPHQGFL